jgi:hypothetical protein
MKKYYFFIAVFIVFCQTSIAQTSETFVLKPGEDLFEKHFSDVFIYPEFKFGKVFYTNGDSAGGRMNYNRFLEAFEFIDNKWDTLVLSPEENIKYFNIGGDIFYYNKPDYLSYKSGSSFCKLAVKQSVKLKDVKKIGAFGISSSTSKIESLDQLRAEQTHQLVANEEIVFSNEAVYYFGNDQNIFLPASKKNILKLYPSKKKEIETYFANHNIDFRNGNHLSDLLNFIEQSK